MAKDPYKYFRVEARELLEGLSQRIIDLEKRGVSKELVNRLLRLAHTLKGAARVVKQGEVSELAHGIEELLEPFRDATGSVPRDRVSRLLELVDTCGERLEPVFLPPEQERTAVPVPPQEPEGAITNVRVEIAEMDTLLSDLADATAHIRAVYQEATALDAAVETASALVTELASGAGPGDSGARAGRRIAHRAEAEQPLLAGRSRSRPARHRRHPRPGRRPSVATGAGDFCADGARRARRRGRAEEARGV